MKRYLLGETPGIDSWQMEDVPAPVLGAGEVRVEMRAWSLNHRDLMVAEGTYGGKRQPGLVPLSDGSGVVAEVGSGVTELQVGDRVATCFFRDWHEGDLTALKAKAARGGAIDGILSEQIVAPANSLVKAPSNLSFAEAATLPCAALTAWNALFDASQLKAGETVLVQGTGGVSIFALQLAKVAGARVIVTSSSDAKLSHAADLGADEGINYRDNPDWERAAFDLTRGIGVDLVLEVGGTDTLPRSMKAVRHAGRISIIGVLTGGQVQFPVGYVFSKNIRMTGIYVGSRSQFMAMNRAIEQADLHPVIDREFAFASAPLALKYMQAAEHVGKIVIVR